MADERIEIDVVGHIVVRYGNIVDSRPTRFCVRREGDDAVVDVWHNFDEKIAEQRLPWSAVREFIVTHFRPQGAKTGPKQHPHG